ncbi:MAG: sensor domain-containing diguanylate cyclase [Magnetococcus sp. DMHC-8]
MTHKSGLLRQATRRVSAVLLAALAVVSVLAVQLQRSAMDHASATLIADLQHHYSEKIQRLEQEWRLTTARLATHLANEHYSREQAWHGLTVTDLATDLAFLDRSQFPVILVVGTDQKILVTLSNLAINLPDRFALADASGWYFDAENGRLFRWHAQSMQAGNRTLGSLVLLVAVDNGLLFLHALPRTDLLLQWQDQLVAASRGTNHPERVIMADGHTWLGGLRHTQISLPWGTGQDQTAHWVIQHHATPLFSLREILLAGPVTLLVLAPLFWWSLGGWVARLAQRITLLKEVSQTFGTRHAISDAVHARLAVVKNSSRDEMSDVAEAMEQLVNRLNGLADRDLRAYVNRIAISALLEIGIEPLALHRKLEVALEIILTVPWLAMQYKGSIFLVTGDEQLEMVAQKNLNNHLLRTCERIPYGFCLCGKAAQQRQIVFANALDERHDVTFDGIREHGHYCIPILLQDKLLGVLNLYVDHGHRYDPEEEAFLTSIANTLAGVIDRGLADDRIRHMASHDALTGLPNRLLFHELLNQEVRRATRYQQTLAVGFVDLDHFKAVNDTLGHEAGDLLLKAVSTRVRQQLRDSDTLARMGGDEFALILPAIGDRDNAIAVCNKIVQTLSEPFLIQDNACQIGASIGLSLFPAHGQEVDTLLQTADQAMYVVKKGGRNGVAVYTEEGQDPAGPLQ